MTTNDNKNLLKNLPRFYCEKCNYGTGKKSSFSEHLLTAKHLKTTIDNQNLPKTCSIKHQCENLLNPFPQKIIKNYGNKLKKIFSASIR
jgi:hypothetical protein